MIVILYMSENCNYLNLTLYLHGFSTGHSYVLGVLASHWKGENLDVLRQKWRVKRPVVIAGIKPRIPGLFGVYFFVNAHYSTKDSLRSIICKVNY